MYIERVSREKFIDICQENYDEDYTARDLFRDVMEWRKSRVIHGTRYSEYSGKLPPFIACVAMPALEYDLENDEGIYTGEDVSYFVVMESGRLYGFEIERNSGFEAAEFYKEEWEAAEEEEEEEEEDEEEEYEDELAVC